MKKIVCASAIFINKDGKLLLEDRRSIKRHGEHFSLFGGKLEPNETVAQCVVREIKEELQYNLTDHKFFLKYESKDVDLHFIYHVYLAKMPNLKQIKVHKQAKAKICTVKQALRLKITDADTYVFQKLQEYLDKKDLNK